jgi:aspartate-semialdehyde dehydrogenase
MDPGLAARQRSGMTRKDHDNVGFIGWRGMVGSVSDGAHARGARFRRIDPVFFTTSNVGGPGPSSASRSRAQGRERREGAREARRLVSCQGGDYTKSVYPKLRAAGWNGYWIDAASALRMEKDAVIILDPVNKAVIDKAVASGVTNYIGGNCTVSLMLMAIDGLLKEDLVEWCERDDLPGRVGARARRTCASCCSRWARCTSPRRRCSRIRPPRSSRSTARWPGILRDEAFPTSISAFPSRAACFPGSTPTLGNGQSREEWKGPARPTRSSA